MGLFTKSTSLAFDRSVISETPLQAQPRSLKAVGRSALSPLETVDLGTTRSAGASQLSETGSTPAPIASSLVQIQPLAQNLGRLSGQTSLTGSLGDSNPYDVYRFDIGDTVGITGVSLTGSGTNAIASNALTVLVEDRNNNGRVDAGEAFEGSSSSPIRRPYSPGTYYVVVYSPAGALNYTLTLETDFAGNTLSTAANLGFGSGQQQFQDSVSGNDSDDYYRFSLDADADVTLVLNGLTADANVQLIQDINNNGVVDGNEILQASANPGTAADAIVRRLTTGNYFIHILPGAAASTNYTLALFVDQAGNNLGSARPLDAFMLSDTRSFYDFAGTVDTDDFYSLTISTPSNLSLLLNGVSDLTPVQLIQDLNANGTVEASEILATSTNPTGTRLQILSRQLEVGTYYLRVVPASATASTNYRLDLTLTGTDQAGNDLATARSIGLSSIPSPFTDWVDSADPNDFYRFGLTSISTVRFTLDALSADANLQLIQDANGNDLVDSGDVLLTSANPGLAAETITQLLAAGNYFIRVYRGSGSTNYRLTGSIDAIADQAGDNLNDARLVNLTEGTASIFNDQLGNGDLNDFYRINVGTGGGALNLLLSGFSADTNVQLIQDLNSDGVVDSNEVVDSAVASGTTAKILNRALAAGTYFVRVTGATAQTSTNYTLSVSLDQAGNALNAARPIALSPTPTTVNDWVGLADPIDYYQITLNATSDLNLQLSGLSAAVNFKLLDSAGNLIQNSALTATGGRSITRSQTPGTYILEVSTTTGNTNYSLQFAATPGDNAGNTPATALDLGVLSGSQTLNDSLSNLDTEDYYRFSVGTAGTLNLQLTNLTADANLFLVQDLDNNGVIEGDEFLQSSINPETTAESITQALTAGTYFAYVLRAASNAETNYALTVNFDQAGDTLATARAITVDASNQSFSDFVSTTVPDTDYYRFTLAASQLFNLAVTTVNQSAAVQLIQDLNGNGVVDSNEVLVSTTIPGPTPLAISQTLAAGTYWLHVLPPTTGDANYTITVSSSPIDWFGLNLRDLSVINLARAAASDGQINRAEAIAILRSTEDSGFVTQAELTDLRALFGNGQSLGIPDYVRILANRVINTVAANQFYQGAQLGSLADGGDRASKLEQLISKWFLGSDRPVAQSSNGQTPYTYRLASGELFQNGVSYTDVRQGDLADCYLLAALGATAFRLPTVIQNMFIDNGDGTYTVRFYNNGVADYITVDRYLPTTALGTFAYDGFDNFYNSTSNELWVALAEKAYAQMNELGWLGQDGTNSYQGIAIGSENTALLQVANRTTTTPAAIDPVALVAAFNAGQLVFLDSNPTTVASSIVPNHEYIMVGFDPTAQTVTLFNPWGTGDHLFNGTNRPGIITLTAPELAANFVTQSFTTTPTATTS